MFTHERHRLIAKLVARKQRVTVGEIQEQLAISPATLRRDLARMEEEGHVIRVHGGVVHPDSLRGEASFSLKSRKAILAKQAIAAAAAALVPDGATVFLDAGTTCLEIGRRLLPRNDLRLATNSVPLLQEAATAGVSILALGGELRPISGALTGLLSGTWLQRITIDWAFVGASGIHHEGAATTELSEAAIKSQVVGQARHAVLAADASKWQASALIRFCEWRELSHWVTSHDLPEAITAAWKPRSNAYPEVIRATLPA